MEQEFHGRQSLVTKLNHRGEALMTDGNASMNHKSLLIRWNTVDTQIQVLFLLIL